MPRRTDYGFHKDLKELTESNSIENENVKRTKNTLTIGKCSPSLSKTGNLCCS